MIQKLFTILAIIFIIQTSSHAQTKLLFVGDKIPKHIYIQSHFIAENSDTLIINNKILIQNTDYILNQKFKRFELNISHANSTDSLVVKYRILPSWLKQKYGTDFPDVTPLSKTTIVELPSELQTPNKVKSDMLVTGSKSFRFSTSKSGSAGFNQTLDLNLSGHLSNNLILQGTISDRGYNPSYGTSNSRLNELDKINLKVYSPNFSAQVGDIIVTESNNSRIREKKISGLNLAYHNRNMQLGMIAARPKGQYTSYTIIGEENKQGPYQIKSQGLRQAIIPGSETVWLDGVEMTRGANEDYIFDYPNGQMTFNVNQRIDTRSRIVIDYEPLSSEYKQEYFHTNSSYFFDDSSYTLNLSWIREGDDKDENLSQAFSNADEQLLANSSHDELIFKSGLISDTLGSYRILSDSLPDTIYYYIDENLGQYDVRFSFVDSGNGAYLYQGTNRYEYVGDGKGDYLPIILLHTPKRTDYVGSSFMINIPSIGQLKTEWKQSRTNNNLFALNSDVVNKNHFQIEYDKLFEAEQHQISAQYSKKENGFAERNRVTPADFAYKFYLPVQSQFYSDEELTSLKLKLQFHKTLSVSPELNYLNYSDQFESQNNAVAIHFTPVKRVSLLGNLQKIKTDYFDSTKTLHGDSKNNNIQMTYNMFKNYNLKSSFKRTERTNDYKNILSGFLHDEYSVQVSDMHSEISYTYFSEDTLVINWEKKRNRKKVQFKSENKIKSIDYKFHIYYQQIDNIIGKESSLLTRANYTYTNRKHNFQMQSSYMLSNETRFSKGIRYIEVNDGEGDYIFRDSQYIPEAGGNFIVVEELLSESAPVKRGEKSFSLSKKWDKVNFTFNSIVNEELFASDSRSSNWIIPFYSNSKQSYLFFSRFVRGSVKAYPISSGYFFTLNLTNKEEKRFINQHDRIKKSFNSELVFTQKVNSVFLEEKIEYFTDERDAYYFREGDIDGFATSAKVKRVLSSNEYAIQLKFRSAESVNKKKSQIYILLLENKFAIKKRGELQFNTEFYKSNKNELLASETYLLTDNRPGLQGAIWSLIFRAKIKKDFRLNLSVQGRHSDINQARIFARTEFVAQF